MTTPDTNMKDTSDVARRSTDARRSSWVGFASRLKSVLQDDNVIIVSAGIAFFFFLALIPALGAIVSIYGVVADPSDILNLAERLSNALPGGGRNLIIDQLTETAASTADTVGWGAVFGILLALWSASTGTTRLITALNIAYDKEARSGLAKKRGIGLLLTVGMIAAVSVAVWVGSNVLSLIDGAGFPGWLSVLAQIAFWVGAAVFFVALLSLIYRWAPNRQNSDWAHIIQGASVAVALAIAVTVGLRIYVANFNNLSEAYGSMTTIIIALFYLFIVAFAIIFGAELDSELQKQPPGIAPG